MMTNQSQYYSRSKTVCETSFGLIQTVPEDKSKIKKKKKGCKTCFKQWHQEKSSICNQSLGDDLDGQYSSGWMSLKTCNFTTPGSHLIHAYSPNKPKEEDSLCPFQ